MDQIIPAAAYDHASRLMSYGYSEAEVEQFLISTKLAKDHADAQRIVQESKAARTSDGSLSIWGLLGLVAFVLFLLNAPTPSPAAGFVILVIFAILRA